MKRIMAIGSDAHLVLGERLYDLWRDTTDPHFLSLPPNEQQKWARMAREIQDDPIFGVDEQDEPGR